MYYISKEELDYLVNSKNANNFEKPVIRFTSKNEPIYVSDINELTDESCSIYLNEIYKIFKNQKFLRISINSSTKEVEQFLMSITNYVSIDKIKFNTYNYHHLGYIYSYFIKKE